MLTVKCHIPTKHWDTLTPYHTCPKIEKKKHTCDLSMRPNIFDEWQTVQTLIRHHKSAASDPCTYCLLMPDCPNIHGHYGTFLVHSLQKEPLVYTGSKAHTRPCPPCSKVRAFCYRIQNKMNTADGIYDSI